jgi:SAM-dependent MidA family methyltransferase
METALYHPEQGYYMTSRDKIGANGDFYQPAWGSKNINHD